MLRFARPTLCPRVSSAASLVKRLTLSGALALVVTAAGPMALAQTATPGGNWVQQSPAASPSARYGAAMAYDPAIGKFVLFGGYTGTAYLSDTWTYDGTNWTLLAPSSSPSVREYSSMVYDAATGALVLFGGYSGSTYLSDTWTFNGTTWTKQSPATNPSARYGSTMAYDAATGTVVLFGGYNGSYLGDTWTYNGTTWTQQSPATSPSARFESTMTYDVATGTVVLFGGYSGSYLGDTWTYNGTTWTKQAPATSPPVRYGSTMTYDAATGTVVLFGGTIGSSDLGDTWTYNGTTWTQQSPTTSPSARYGSTMAYDAATGTVVLFGGYSGSVDADTWTYAAGSFVAPTTPVGTAAAQTPVYFTIVTAGTLPALANANVLTTGIANLDFTLGTGSTCTGAVTANQTCTVNVVFTPGAPGLRKGAVVLKNSSGAILATAYVTGTGTAGQALYQNGVQSMISTTLNSPRGLSLDVAGNIYLGNVGTSTVLKLPAGSSTATTLASITAAGGTAVDGAGNLFVAADGNGLYEIPAGTTTPTAIGTAGLSLDDNLSIDSTGTLYGSNVSTGAIYQFTPPNYTATILSSNSGKRFIGMALDASGDLFAADFTGSALYELKAGASTLTLLYSGAPLSSPASVAVDAAGNVYVSNNGGTDVYRFGAGNYTATPTTTAMPGAQSLTIGPDGSLYTVSSNTLYRYTRPAAALTFPSTQVNSVSAAQTVTLENDGNLAVTVSVPGSGINPAVSGQYVLGGSGTCAQISSMGTAQMLASGATCTDAITFNPRTVSATNSGTLTTTDNSNNVAGSTQVVSLTGVSTGTSTTTAIAVSPTSGVVAGQTVTLTATLSPTAATGSVQFFDNGAAVGTSVAVTSGTASYMETDIDADSHSFTAVFTGTGAFAASTSSAASLTVTGSVAVGSPSVTQTVSVDIMVAGTLSAINAVTQGTTGLDFATATGGTCATSTAYTVGQSCTVEYTFKPLGAGLRRGAILLLNSAGTVLGTGYISGTGTGPQGVFVTPTVTALVSGAGVSFYDVVEDGAGDLYAGVAGPSGIFIYRYPAGSSTKTTVATNGTNAGLGIDGAGNVYYVSNLTLWQIPAGTGTPVQVSSNGCQNNQQIVVDGAGNIYIPCSTAKDVIELAAGTYTLLNTFGSGTIGAPDGLSLDGSGNLYVSDATNNKIWKITPANVATAVVTGITDPQDTIFDAAGDLIVANATSTLTVYAPGFGSSTTITGVTTGGNSQGIYLTTAGNVVVTDSNGNLNLVNRSTTPAIAFGSTPVGSASAQSLLAVENAGNAALSISSIAAMGGSSSSFVFAGAVDGSYAACGTTLASGVACGLGATFTPPSGGTFSSTGTLTDNSLNVSTATQTVALSGTGTVVQPIVSGISPTNGPPAGGTTVTITGTNLVGVTGVKFGTVAATSFTIVNNTSVTAVSPAESAGTVAVTVANSSYTSATSAADNFTYATPTTTALSVSPASPTTVTPITLTATISPTAATGSVQFTDNGTNVGSPVTVSSGTAAYTISSPTLGSNVFQANFTASLPYVSSSSTTQTVTVTYPAAYTAPTTAVGMTTTQTAYVTFTTAGTLGAINVLTQGVANKDYLLVSSSCSTATGYSVGNSCAVTYTFAPVHPGVRLGGITLTDTSGNLMGSSYVVGQGTGPQVTFPNQNVGTSLSSFGAPKSVAVDAVGNIFVADGSKVEEVLAPGYGNPIVLGGSYVFRVPRYVAVDGLGNVFVADTGTYKILEIVAAGGYTTVNTLASAYNFYGPGGLAVDGSGNVFVTELNGFVEEVLAAGGYTTVNTLIGQGLNKPHGVALDGSRNIFVCDYGNGAVKEFLAAGGYSTFNYLASSSFQGPYGIAVDGSGNVFVTDSSYSTLTEILSAGGYSMVQTLSSGFVDPSAVAVDGSGNVFVADDTNSEVTESNFTAPPAVAFQMPTAVGTTDINDGTQIVTLNNGGTADLFIASIAASNSDFTVTGMASSSPFANTPSCNTDLAAGSSCSIGVAFTPQTNGANTANGNVTDNNLNVGSSVQMIALSGTGFYTAATVTGITPASGSTAGGTMVTITGTNFNGAAAVNFGATAGSSVTVVSSTQITAVSPAEAAGTVDVTVTNPSATSATSAADRFTYLIATTTTLTVSPASPTTVTPITLTATITPTAATGTVQFTDNGTNLGSPVTVSGGTAMYTISNPSAGSNVFQANFTATGTYGSSSSPTQTVTVTYPAAYTVPATPVGMTTTQTAYVTVTTAGTLGAINALTQGVANKDYQLVSSSCSTMTRYSVGNYCTVTYTFAPTQPGVRLGGITLTDTSGNLMGNSYVVGQGTGPQVTFPNQKVGTALGSNFNSPYGLAVDAGANVFVADTINNQIKEIVAKGGYTTVQQLASSFVFSDPEALAVDGSGNIFVADFGASLLVEIVAAGGYSTVNTLASSHHFNGLNGVAVDGSGNVFVAETSSNLVEEIPVASGYTTVNTLGYGFNNPYNVAVDGSGNVFVADLGNHAVKEILAASGYTTVNTLGSGFTYPYGVALDGSGDVFVADVGSEKVQEILSAGGYVTVNTLGGGFSQPTSIGLDGSGNLFVADEQTSTIIELSFATLPTVTFPTVTGVGTTDTTDGTQVVALSNEGTSALSIASIAPSNSNFTFAGAASASPFAGTAACGTTLAAGAFCSIGVTFTPQTSGPITANGIVTDNNRNVSGSMQVIALNGTGVFLTPTVTGISPPSGAAAGGTLVTITGTNFVGNMTVMFGGTGANNVTVVSSTQITASSPSHTGGTVDVTVSGSGGTSATSATDQFTYLAPTTTSLSVSPNNPTTATPIMLQASIAPSYATGTVQFTDNGANVGSPVTVSGGMAAYTISAPTLGSNTFQAIFTGTGTNASSTSSTVTLTVTYPTAYTAPTEPVGTLSPTQTATVTMTAAGTPGSINVLTEGIANLDYNLVGGTCSTSVNYSVGQSCTVTYTFKPSHPGVRLGGITLTQTNSTGTLLGGSYVVGQGTGPQVTFPNRNAGTSLGRNFSYPDGVAVDANGNVFVADTGNNQIKEILAAGGYMTVNRLATSSSFSSPLGVAVDGSGNVFVADSHGVEEIVAAGGYTVVNPLGSGFNGPSGVAVDGRGNVFVADSRNYAIKEILATGGYSNVNTLFSGGPRTEGIALDGNGDVFFTDSSSNVKELLAAGGYSTVNTLGSGFSNPFGLAVDGSGNVFVVDGGSAVKEILAGSGYTTVETLTGGFNFLDGVAVDGSGNLFLAINGSSEVQELPFATAPSISFPTSTAPGTTDTTDGTQVVTLTNDGTSTLSIASILPSNSDFTFTGAASSSPFPSTVACGTTLASGAFCSIGVTFTPQTSGTNTANGNVTDNSLNVANAVQAIALSGTGTYVRPMVTGISPTSGSTTGGTTVTISGMNFAGATVVMFGSTAAASFTVVSSTQITAVSPAEASGTVDVTVSNPTYTGYTNVSDQFTYVVSTTTTLSVSPASPTTAMSITLSATVSPSGASGGMQFTDNGTNLGTTVFSSSPVTLIINNPTPGSHTYQANYTGTQGSTNYGPSSSSPQTVTVAVASAYTAPTEPVGTKSPTQTAYVAITTAGTPGSINVLTQGAANLDYNPVGGTCSTSVNYSVGQSCTVTYTFKPSHPGVRLGGITLADGNGDLLGNSYVVGQGTGSQVTFPNQRTGTALGTGLLNPEGVAVDSNGNVFVADTGNNQVKEILAAGGYTTVNALGGTSTFNSPTGVAVDGSGNIFVADFGNKKVKEILAAGGYTTVNTLAPASRYGPPAGVAVDGSGNVFVADIYGSEIDEIPAAGGYTNEMPIVTNLDGPMGVAIDGSGNLFVADSGSNSVKEALAAGGYTTVNTLPIAFNYPTGVVVDGSGNIFVADTGNHAVKEILAAGGYAKANTLGSGYSSVFSVAVDGSGNVYVADDGADEVEAFGFATSPAVSFPTATALGTTDTTDGTQIVTLNNDGTSTLSIASIAPSNSDFTFAGAASSSPFPGTAACGTTLASGAFCSIGVTFTPQMGGANTANGNVTDNNLNVTNAVQAIALSGTGTYATPTVTGLSPFSGPTTGGTTVVITGTNFVGATSVTFGTTAATSFTVNSATQITAVSPPVQTQGSTRVFVSNPSYTSNPSSYSEFYYYAPTTTTLGVSPASPTTATPITLTATLSPTAATGMVQFTDNGANLGSPVTLSGGTATYMINNPAAGSHAFQAIYPGTGPYGMYGSSSSSIQMVTVTAGQTITFPQPATPAAAGTTETLTATASSGLPVTYSITSGPATVSGSTVTYTGAGTVVIAANQSGNGSYAAAATVSQTVQVIVNYVWLVNAPGTVTRISEGASQSSTVGTLSSPAAQGGIAFDSSGNSWSVTLTNNQIFETNSLATSETYLTGGGLSSPSAIAIDGAGSAWVVNTGNNSVSLFTNAGTPITPSKGYAAGELNNPSSVSVDASGGLWIANKSGNSITHVLGAAIPVSTPLSRATASGTLGARP